MRHCGWLLRCRALGPTGCLGSCRAALYWILVDLVGVSWGAAAGMPAMARASAPRVRALTNQMSVIQRADGMLVCPAPPAAPLARSDRPSACTPWLRTTCTAPTRWADLLKKETPHYPWRTQHATAAPCFSCVTFGASTFHALCSSRCTCGSLPSTPQPRRPPVWRSLCRCPAPCSACTARRVGVRAAGRAAVGRWPARRAGD